MFASVDHYITDLFGQEDDALKAVEPSLDKAGIPQISVSPNLGKLLQVFAQLCGAKRILEIGTLGAYSSIWMARALPEEGKLITLEVDPMHAEVAARNIEAAGLTSKVEIRMGPAIEALDKMIAEQEPAFDMIFIDADKPPYPDYFRRALKLSRKGTLIVADNVIREGKVLIRNSADDRVRGAQQFNELLAATESVNATIIQTVGVKEHDGMAIAIVK